MRKKGISYFKVLLWIYIVFVIFFTIFPYMPTGVNHIPAGYYYNYPRHTQSKKSSCCVNLRILTGAIEMYNMDNDENNKIKNIDDNIINKLIKKGYLKSKPKLPRIECEYIINYDNNNAFIYCKIHGSLDGSIPDKTNDEQLFKEEETKQRIKDYINYRIKEFPYALVWPLLIPGGLLLSIFQK